ncbi:TetR/AcrR family transcriptional regulator [Mycobacterium sp.]|uniref:TetR/AcrR family transcriptional regulator n=1 Tax=Mycobacterium sp. TaxID=1785 RepID=UPI002C38046D|nr:TetR/AcrR family transcriptional regulator [Mycobacterium sp.]HKP42740.1 TetR/AcrR family transcriptional regulator [Mycobacterium sp.]
MPKIVDPEERRTAIIHAAYRVIARAGFDGATLRSIAEEAGFTTGVIGHYFRNKDHVLEASLKRSVDDAFQRIEHATDSKHGLAAVRAAVAQVLPDDPQLAIEWAVWLSFWGRSIGNDTLVKEHRMRYEEWHSVLSKFFRQAVDLGEVRDDLKPAECADLVVGALYGIGVHTVINGMRPKKQRAMVELLLTSLATWH